MGYGTILRKIGLFKNHHVFSEKNVSDHREKIDTGCKAIKKVKIWTTIFCFTHQEKSTFTIEKKTIFPTRKGDGESTATFLHFGCGSRRDILMCWRHSGHFPIESSYLMIRSIVKHF
jgi:hypothetical protein